MGSKKKHPPATSTSLPALRIGSRVRCTDDGVSGRIVWANGTSVKIRWDDGEQVTWRRDSLDARPLEFLDPVQAGDEGRQAEPPLAAPAPQQTAPEQAVPAAVAPDEAAAGAARTETAKGTTADAAAEQATDAHPTPTAAVPEPLRAETSGDAAAAGVTAPDVTPAGAATAGPATREANGSLAAPEGSTTAGAANDVNDAPAEATTPEAAPVPPEPGRDGTPAAGKRKKAAKAGGAEAPPAGAAKLSALDAAAKVLAEAGQALTCPEMIAAMAAKGYWSSPAGKTPAATLCSALLRELQTKGDGARFRKTGRGQFARSGSR